MQLAAGHRRTHESAAREDRLALAARVSDEMGRNEPVTAAPVDDTRRDWLRCLLTGASGSQGRGAQNCVII
jgi:hypothetical protein